jgi:hypothetical protein
VLIGGSSHEGTTWVVSPTSRTGGCVHVRV